MLVTQNLGPARFNRAKDFQGWVKHNFSWATYGVNEEHNKTYKVNSYKAQINNQVTYLQKLISVHLLGTGQEWAQTIIISF